VPVGLIVNEAVTNALKHAFPDGRPGVVLVRVRRCGDGSLRLEVEDERVIRRRCVGS
jgi:two-component sensor histidine kinase